MQVRQPQPSTVTHGHVWLQVRQLQTNTRLAEAAWKEERRSEVALGAQREKNLQAAAVLSLLT